MREPLVSRNEVLLCASFADIEFRGAILLPGCRFRIKVSHQVS